METTRSDVKSYADRWPARLEAPPARARRARKAAAEPVPAASIAFVTARVSCLACGTTLDTFALTHGPVEILCGTCGTFRSAVPAP